MVFAEAVAAAGMGEKWFGFLSMAQGNWVRP